MRLSIDGRRRVGLAQRRIRPVGGRTRRKQRDREG